MKAAKPEAQIAQNSTKVTKMEASQRGDHESDHGFFEKEPEVSGSKEEVSDPSPLNDNLSELAKRALLLPLKQKRARPDYGGGGGRSGDGKLSAALPLSLLYYCFLFDFLLTDFFILHFFVLMKNRRKLRTQCFRLKYPG